MAILLPYLELVLAEQGKLIPFAIVFTVLWLLFLSIPNLILNINYWLIDRKKNITVDFDSESITIEKKDKQTIYFKDIVKMYKIGGFSKSDGCYSVVPWGHYYYYKIELQNNSSLYFTRFLAQNFEKKLSNISYEYLQQKYPFVSNTPHFGARMTDNI